MWLVLNDEMSAVIQFIQESIKVNIFLERLTSVGGTTAGIHTPPVLFHSDVPLNYRRFCVHDR